MKPFEGFKSEANRTNKIGPLPAGAYVAKILDAKVEGNEPNQMLVIAVDVSEGEHAGYFTKRFQNDKDRSKGQYDVKYKGIYKLRVPGHANAKNPENDLRNFNDAIFRIEQSNPDYHWDWNEKGLAGLTVGINMQDREFNDVPFTAIGRFETADDVRNGLVKPMKPRGSQNNGYVQVADEELPWDDKRPYTTTTNENTYF